MLIAQKKKHENIAEYVLYMFQLEDLMRACQFDMAVVDSKIVSKFDTDSMKLIEIKSWYQELIFAMKDQKLEQKGHLAYLNAIIADLSSFNISLLQKESNSSYSKLFSDALPALTEIVQKSDGTVKNEIDAAFTLLYGVMIMRMKGQDVSPETKNASEQISSFLRVLVKEFHEQGKKQE